MKILRLLPLADQSFVSASNFFLNFLMIKYFNLQGYGSFVLLWSVVLFFSGLQEAAIISPLMIYGPKKSVTDRPLFFGSMLIHQICFGGISSVVVLIAIYFIGPLVDPLFERTIAQPLALCLFFYQLHDFLRRVFYTSENYVRVIGIDFIAYGGQLAGMLTLIYAHSLNLKLIFTCYALAYAGAILFCLVPVRAFHFNRKQSYIEARTNWSMTRWLFPSALLQWCGANLLLLLTSYMLGVWAAGAFRAMQNIVGVLHVFLITAENTIPVRASKALREYGLFGMLRYALRTAAFSALIAALYLAPIFFFPKVVISLVYGSKYDEFANILQAFCIFYIFIFVGIPVRAAIRLSDRSRAIFESNIISTVLSLGSAYFLIPYYGPFGLILALLLSQVVVQAFLALRLYGIVIHQSVLPN